MMETVAWSIFTFVIGSVIGAFLGYHAGIGKAIKEVSEFSREHFAKHGRQEWE